MKKRKTKKRRVLKSHIFVQDWGTYANDTLVCVGATHADVLKFLRGMKGVRPNVFKEIDNDEDRKLFETFSKESYGFFRLYPESNISVLWLKDRKSTRLNSSHLKLSRMPSSA